MWAVNANGAGEGNLEIEVTTDGDSVPNIARQVKETEFTVTFTPKRATRHVVSVSLLLSVYFALLPDAGERRVKP